MEHIRLIHFPNCRMVTSGTGFFGDENFTRFEKLLAAEARTTPYPMDFLTGNEHGMEWLYLYREGMDTFGMEVIDFRGGLYAVVCGIMPSPMRKKWRLRQYLWKSMVLYGTTTDRTWDISLAIRKHKQCWGMSRWTTGPR